MVALETVSGLPRSKLDEDICEGTPDKEMSGEKEAGKCGEASWKLSNVGER